MKKTETWAFNDNDELKAINTISRQGRKIYKKSRKDEIQAIIAFIVFFVANFLILNTIFEKV